MSQQIAANDIRQAFERARDLDGSINDRLSAFAEAVLQARITS